MDDNVSQNSSFQTRKKFEKDSFEIPKVEKPQKKRVIKQNSSKSLAIDQYQKVSEDSESTIPKKI